MRIDPAVPTDLDPVDFTRLIFVLEFSEAPALDVATLLGFRSLIRPVAKQVFAGAGGREHFKALFEPEIGHDPVALKKFQKPAPPFVLSLRPGQPQAGGGRCRQELEGLFLGTSIPLIGDFLACLVRLGQCGIVEGRGKFAVTALEAVGQDEQVQGLWQQGDRLDRIAPPIDSIGLWLERRLPVDLPLVLQFVTPTRVMANGRPLRHPSFADLFPFMLRRVTSMLYAHAGCELMPDTVELLRAARTVVPGQTDFAWHDWRDLPGRQRMPAIGGFTGSLCVEGGDLCALFWVIAVASLFGIGKSAAYGAGRFRLAGLRAGNL